MWYLYCQRAQCFCTIWESALRVNLTGSFIHTFKYCDNFVTNDSRDLDFYLLTERAWFVGLFIYFSYFSRSLIFATNVGKIIFQSLPHLKYQWVRLFGYSSHICKLRYILLRIRYFVYSDYTTIHNKIHY